MAANIPLIGGLISGAMQVIGKIFINLDGYEQLPQYLLNGKNKLI